MIYSIGKRIKNFVKVRIYQYSKQDKIPGSGHQYTNEDCANYELKKWFYASGRLKAETFYKDGRLEGIANYYYESGEIKAREFYKNNQLTGLSKWYYESGEVKSERYYQDGTLVSRREFDKAGRLINSNLTD